MSILPKKYLTLISLENIEKHLPEDQFIKVQRSFLVAISRIEPAHKNIMIIAEHKIPISRRWRAKILNTIVVNKMIKRYANTDINVSYTGIAYVLHS